MRLVYIALAALLTVLLHLLKQQVAVSTVMREWDSAEAFDNDSSSTASVMTDVSTDDTTYFTTIVSTNVTTSGEDLTTPVPGDMTTESAASATMMRMDHSLIQ